MKTLLVNNNISTRMKMLYEDVVGQQQHLHPDEDAAGSSIKVGD